MFFKNRYIANRQPGKALPFFLRLRRPNVFDLICENNLFTDVQDQALLLVEFDQELMEKRKKEGGLAVYDERHDAITLLVDHIHSIPVSALIATQLRFFFWHFFDRLVYLQIGRVVQQLQSRPYYLFLYLDALMTRDPNLVSGFADLQVCPFSLRIDLLPYLPHLGQAIRRIRHTAINRFPPSEQLL
jgi:hypothetical protein